jgi:hypothetical protein
VPVHYVTKHLQQGIERVITSGSSGPCRGLAAWTAQTGR